MFKLNKTKIILRVLSVSAIFFAINCVVAQAKFPNVGRAATQAEMAAWNIDVRPDFKGIPKGQGTVAKGEQVWEAKCASCHGSFGESNSVFNPIVGGVKKADVAAGRVASLASDAPERSTMAKLSTVSTLWDYINRAMPWNLPKSLSVEEVYAVTAYVLHLGDVLPAEFTLSDKNIADVQKRLPNRNGMTQNHALWPGLEVSKSARPDVQGSACMNNCKVSAKVASLIPDYAMNAHGNLAEQARPLGATRGLDTSRFGINTDNKSAVLSASIQQVAKENIEMSVAISTVNMSALLSKNTCTACHADNNKLVGPSWAEIAKKYDNKGEAVAYLAGKVKQGGQGVWGAIPMPEQALSVDEAQVIAKWLAAGARKQR